MRLIIRINHPSKLMTPTHLIKIFGIKLESLAKAVELDAQNEIKQYFESNHDRFFYKTCNYSIRNLKDAILNL